MSGNPILTYFSSAIKGIFLSQGHHLIPDLVGHGVIVTGSVADEPAHQTEILLVQAAADGGRKKAAERP